MNLRANPYTQAFFLGAVIIGAFDFLYTEFGGQSYAPRFIIPPFERWPFYIPVQMGLAGMLILTLWARIAERLRKLVPEFTAEQPSSRAVAFPLGALGVVLPACFAFLGTAWHNSVFTLLLMVSYGVLILRGSRLELFAFFLVGLAGGLTEWFLLSPTVDYWAFRHQDLFGRLPAWEPVVYGWVGVVIHRLSRRAGVPQPHLVAG